MTRAQFNAICQAHTIAPNVALDNPRVVELLKRNQGRVDDHVAQELNSILATEF